AVFFGACSGCVGCGLTLGTAQTQIVLSALVVASLRPSGAKAIEVISCVSLAMLEPSRCPVLVSQSRTVWSAQPAARMRPSGEKASSVIALSAAFMVATGAIDCSVVADAGTTQSLITSSAPALASSLPLGAKLKAKISPVWPDSVANSRPLFTYHNLTGCVAPKPPRTPVAKSRPSGENATAPTTSGSSVSWINSAAGLAGL